MSKSARIDLQDPEPKRDFIYIDDVIRALIKSIIYKTLLNDLFMFFEVLTTKSDLFFLFYPSIEFLLFFLIFVCSSPFF